MKRPPFKLIIAILVNRKTYSRAFSFRKNLPISLDCSDLHNGSYKDEVKKTYLMSRTVKIYFGCPGD